MWLSPGAGIAVVDGEKAVFCRERFNLRVLADDHNAHKLPARHGLERAADYAHAADGFLQFVAPEAPGIAAAMTAQPIFLRKTDHAPLVSHSIPARAAQRQCFCAIRRLVLRKVLFKRREICYNKSGL